MCVPQCSRIRGTAVESVFLVNGFLRLCIYVLLSILTFTHKTINIMTGIFLVITGLLHLMGWAVQKYEEKETAGGALLCVCVLLFVLVLVLIVVLFLLASFANPNTYNISLILPDPRSRLVQPCSWRAR